MSELEARTDLTDQERLDKKDEMLAHYGVQSERVHTLQQLLKGYTMFNKDDEYVVMDGQVKIVDEQTGRIMEGRRWSDGLHQAIEAKEHVKVEAATQTFATITLQNYFRMYHKLAGMTGTASTESGEFWISTNSMLLRFQPTALSSVRTWMTVYTRLPARNIVQLSTKSRKHVMLAAQSW